jgi:hypothetical protein
LQSCTKKNHRTLQAVAREGVEEFWRERRAYMIESRVAWSYPWRERARGQWENTISVLSGAKILILSCGPSEQGRKLQRTGTTLKEPFPRKLSATGIRWCQQKESAWALLNMGASRHYKSSAKEHILMPLEGSVHMARTEDRQRVSKILHERRYSVTKAQKDSIFPCCL